MKENNLQQNLSFFNRWAHCYDSCWFQFWMKGFHRPVFQEIDFTKPARILDISCGTGELLKSLQEKDRRVNLQLSGMDISAEMLKQAQPKLPGINFSLGDVHHVPFPANTFDYVLSTEAFHHYYGQRKALQEMVRITKPGGKVIVVDINFFLRPIHWLFQKFEPGCQKINIRKAMRKLLVAAGLQHVRQQRSFLFAVMTVGEKGTAVQKS